MAAAGAKAEADDGAEREMRVSITAPLSPAKPTFVQLVGTLNTLWGSDRVLRTAQFVGRLVGGSPEVRPWAQYLAVLVQNGSMGRKFVRVDGSCVSGSMHASYARGPVAFFRRRIGASVQSLLRIVSGSSAAKRMRWASPSVQVCA